MICKGLMMFVGRLNWRAQTLKTRMLMRVVSKSTAQVKKNGYLRRTLAQSFKHRGKEGLSI